MREGVCKLCLEIRPLCDSHALPNSIFKHILRRNDGKAIVISDDVDTPVQFSSDTWDVELLCADCERQLNERYDAYGLAVVRGYEGTTLPEADGIRFLRIDRRRFRMFFLSILWRVAVSTHSSYSNVDLPFELKENLRVALLSGKYVHENRYSVVVCKLRDSTPVDGFDNETVREFICTPFVRNYGTFMSVCFPFLSFFVEIAISKVPERFSKRQGILRGKSPVFLAPYSELLDIPEIMRLLVRGLEKHYVGLSRVD